MNADGRLGPDGMQPECDVAVADSGDIFGSTIFGGPANQGIAWEISRNGEYKDLHDFGGMVTDPSGVRVADGENPMGSLTFDDAGNLYGAASGGGQTANGMIWKIEN
jgi:hypothetical protein